jgi:FKBP-type peptidyl-prolyl cis-trans isomerase SlyD
MTPERVDQDVVVSIQYRLTSDDGTLLEESQAGDPLVYMHGHDNIITGLERELTGMAVGEAKTIIVEPADGYGEYDPEDMERVSKSEMPSGFEPEVGMLLEVHDDEDEDYVAIIKEVTDDGMLLDFNHPLSGQRLHFDVTVEELRAATSEEVAHGHAHSDDDANHSDHHH